AGVGGGGRGGGPGPPHPEGRAGDHEVPAPRESLAAGVDVIEDEGNSTPDERVGAVKGPLGRLHLELVADLELPDLAAAGPAANDQLAGYAPDRLGLGVRIALGIVGLLAGTVAPVNRLRVGLLLWGFDCSRVSATCCIVSLAEEAR